MTTVQPLPLLQNSVKISLEALEKFNHVAASGANRANLDYYGGSDQIVKNLGIDLTSGLSEDQVLLMRKLFGSNYHKGLANGKTLIQAFIDCFSKVPLVLLTAAAVLQLVLHLIYNDPHGQSWVEDLVIIIGVCAVVIVGGLQEHHRDNLVKSFHVNAFQEELATVLRNNIVHQIRSADVVVGDILLVSQGCKVSADAIILTDTVNLYVNETALDVNHTADKMTYESKKCKAEDCFLLAPATIMSGEECRAIVIAVGNNTQWSKVGLEFSNPSVMSKMQYELKNLVEKSAYFGLMLGIGIFVAGIVNYWTKPAIRLGLTNSSVSISAVVFNYFFLACAIAHVCITDFLSQAVSIALASAADDMSEDNLYIRNEVCVDALGKVTDICCDKSALLSGNLKVVEGWFCEQRFGADNLHESSTAVPEDIRHVIIENICMNQQCSYVMMDKLDSGGDVTARESAIAGNEIERALLQLASSWGVNGMERKREEFAEGKDRYGTIAGRPKSTVAVIHRTDGSIRVVIKDEVDPGLNDCATYLKSDGTMKPLTAEMRKELEELAISMAYEGLSVLFLGHKDFDCIGAQTFNMMSGNGHENKSIPIIKDYCLDCVLGLFDPLHEKSSDAVRAARAAKVNIRLWTQENAMIAREIAKKSGVLTERGLILDGKELRDLAKNDPNFEEKLSYLQVLSKANVNDKHFLISHICGKSRVVREPTLVDEEFQKQHDDAAGAELNFDGDIELDGDGDLSRRGARAVMVTGSLLEDIPSFKKSDVSVAFSKRGMRTAVTEAAADVIVYDESFSSIVMAVLWGRYIHDVIQQAIQYQFTSNFIVAVFVLIVAACGFTTTINVIQLLWIKIVIESLSGALLQEPVPLDRYVSRDSLGKNENLMTKFVYRNIVSQCLLQLGVLLVFLYLGPAALHVNGNDPTCYVFNVKTSSPVRWDPYTSAVNMKSGNITCNSFHTYCPGQSYGCFYDMQHKIPGIPPLSLRNSTNLMFSFSKLQNFEKNCLSCRQIDYRHQTFLFNTFVFQQVFHSINSREVFNGFNILWGVLYQRMYLFYLVVIVVVQVMMIQYGGFYLALSPMDTASWLISTALAATVLPASALLKVLLPFKEKEKLKLFRVDVPEGAKHQNFEFVNSIENV